jgi:hypothetical protein
MVYKYPPRSVTFSFFSPLNHFIFFLQPRRRPDLISGELVHGKLLSPPLQGHPRPEITAVDREIQPAADPWSSEAHCSKSDDLIFADASKNRHAINGMFAGPVEEEAVA